MRSNRTRHEDHANHTFDTLTLHAHENPYPALRMKSGHRQRETERERERERELRASSTVLCRCASELQVPRVNLMNSTGFLSASCIIIKGNYAPETILDRKKAHRVLRVWLYSLLLGVLGSKSQTFSSQNPNPEAPFPKP